MSHIVDVLLADNFVLIVGIPVGCVFWLLRSGRLFWALELLC